MHHKHQAYIQQHDHKLNTTQDIKINNMVESGMPKSSQISSRNNLMNPNIKLKIQRLHNHLSLTESTPKIINDSLQIQDRKINNLFYSLFNTDSTEPVKILGE